MRIDSKQTAFIALFGIIAGAAFSNAVFEIFAAIFIVLFLWDILRSRSFSAFRETFFLLLLIYFAMNILSLTQTEYWTPSIRGVVKAAKGVLLCAGAFYVADSEKKLKEIFQWILVIAFIVGVDAILQGFLGVDPIARRKMAPYTAEIGRLTGPFRHATDFAAYLATVIFIFVMAVFDGWNFLRKFYFLYAAGLAAVFYSFLRTYSRGAWLAAAITFIALILCRRSKGLFLFFLGIILFAYWFSPPAVIDRFTNLLNPADGTVIERKILWKESGQMIRQAPLLGMGVNTYARNEPAFKVSKTDFQYAHNGYLQMAAEIGLLGLLSFLTLVTYFFISGLKVFFRAPPYFTRMAGMGLIFAVLSFLLASATDTGLHSLRLVNFFWVLMGLAWAAKKLHTHAG
ncbi:MAG: O-antigen ligase family protein [Candidatus Omnitrophica bacterium]|nr:O-antigen ligase family protein [Candidatus Omnitrophota bacterium]